MLSSIFTVFFFVCLIFFLGVLFYTNFIKPPKKLESTKKEWYNETNESKDKVSPNQR